LIFSPAFVGEQLRPLLLGGVDFSAMQAQRTRSWRAVPTMPMALRSVFNFWRAHSCWTANALV
jgi:hypothetical protein